MAINIADSFNRTTAQPPFAGVVFADLTARDAYANTLRYEGMECYVVAEQLYYSLVGGVANGNWIEREGGSGSGVVAVADIATRNAIPEEDRALGMIVQVQTIADYDGPLSFQLVGGITNAYWVIFDDILVFPAMSDLVASSPALHKLGIRAFIINLNLVYVLTLSGWSAEVTQDNNVTITNKDIDGGTASNTSRNTIPRAATIEAAAALVRKKATLLYNDFTNKFLKDNGTDLKSIPDFGDVNIFAQEIAADNVIGSWTQNLSGITATFTKGTDSRLGTCYKLDITSAASGAGGTYTVRKDFAVPERVRGTFVELSYDYVSTVSKTGTCVILYDVTNSTMIVPQTEIQAQPDPTSLTTKGFITFSIPSTCATLRVFIGRSLDASAIAISNQYFYFNNLQFKKYQAIINPIRPAIGTIQEFAGPVANIPYGFLNCDGAAVSRSTYAKLFAVIGTTYGTGDGSTTFNLPNSQGISLRGVGSQTFGSVTYSATLGQKRNDAIQNITGSIGSTTYQRLSGTKSGAFGNISGATAQDESGTFHGAVQSGIDFDASRVVRTDTQTHGADLAVVHMICFDDGPARYADYTLNQDVSFVGFRAASTAASTTVNVKVDSVKDTVGAWDAVNGEYEVKSAGDYTAIFAGKVSSGSSAVVYKNGVSTSYQIGTTGSATYTLNGTAIIPNCIIGDKLSIRTTASINLTDTYLSFSKRTTSQQLFTPITQRYVVKTYQSGTSWYEVYNDGWVRQGDYINSDTDSSRATTLVIPMKDANYTPRTTIISTSTASPTWEKVGFSAISSTQVTLWAGSVLTKKWSVEGFGNSAAVKALGANPNY